MDTGHKGLWFEGMGGEGGARRGEATHPFPSPFAGSEIPFGSTVRFPDYQCEHHFFVQVRGVTKDFGGTGMVSLSSENDPGPKPRPLAQRLSGARHEGADAETGVDEAGADHLPAYSVGDATTSEGGAKNLTGLRLESTKDKESGDIDDDGGTPPRGPPKTPKRNKGSSPQVSNVSAPFDTKKVSLSSVV